MEDDFIDEGHMLFEPDIVREPMLPAVRALVDGIAHCARVDRGREFRVDRQGRHAAGRERLKLFPGRAAVAGLVHGFVRRDIDDVGVRRMERDRDHRRFARPAGQEEQADQADGCPEQGSHSSSSCHHNGRRPNHSVAIESR